MITNPISFVKNTRTTFSRSQEKSITEVYVQFADEEPAWIPMDTLEAMMKTLLTIKSEIMTEQQEKFKDRIEVEQKNINSNVTIATEEDWEDFWSNSEECHSPK